MERALRPTGLIEIPGVSKFRVINFFKYRKTKDLCLTFTEDFSRYILGPYGQLELSLEDETNLHSFVLTEPCEFSEILENFKFEKKSLIPIKTFLPSLKYILERQPNCQSIPNGIDTSFKLKVFPCLTENGIINVELSIFVGGGVGIWHLNASIPNVMLYPKETHCFSIENLE